jgi:glycine/D-amino acid oxidase-like deaminating enzyme
MHTPLGENLSVDACIVGAGIAGLSTAYLLARAGKSVVVVDDGPIGGGMTQMTSAHLTNMMDDRYSSSSACTAKKGRASRPKATARRPRPLRHSNQRPCEPRPLSSAGLRQVAPPMCRDAGPSSARRGCARLRCRGRRARRQSKRGGNATRVLPHTSALSVAPRRARAGQRVHRRIPRFDMVGIAAKRCTSPSGVGRSGRGRRRPPSEGNQR